MSHRRNPRAKIVRRITLTRTETKTYMISIQAFEHLKTMLQVYVGLHAQCTCCYSITKPRQLHVHYTCLRVRQFRSYFLKKPS